MISTITARPTGRSPLARLALFIVILAFAGSLVAGVHYYASGMSPQVQAPTNGAMEFDNPYDACVNTCDNIAGNCIVAGGGSECIAAFNTCATDCEKYH